jgi:hypothetical protein
MHFYTVTVASNFINRPLLSEFHASMFHGLAEREGRVHPHDAKVWASSSVVNPLVVSRTVCNVPDISQPSTHLVVSERIANSLKTFKNIRLVPVVFKRLVDVEYKTGDMSWQSQWGTRDPNSLLRELPEADVTKRNIGTFYEMLTYRLNDVSGQYPTAASIVIEQRTPPMQVTEDISISKEMLADYPSLWWGSVIMSEELFAVLDPHLDRDFFIVRKYAI